LHEVLAKHSGGSLFLTGLQKGDVQDFGIVVVSSEPPATIMEAQKFR
jgi:hypothetical protein